MIKPQNIASLKARLLEKREKLSIKAKKINEELALIDNKLSEIDE